MVDRTPTETFKKSINTVKVNHVLSTNTYSNIFEAIFKYFMKYSDANKIEHFFSVKPLDNMDIYHYHRPNIESNILKNSFTTVHHDLEDTDSWLDIDKFIAKYRKIDKIICLNETQKLILEKYGLNKTLVIPWGYNQDIFSSKDSYVKKPSINKICLGVVSKRYGRKVKGEALLYELAKRLPVNRFKFMLVGEGRVEDANYLNKLGFETKVYEYLPYKLFDSLYTQIDVLLITSFYEGGPANILEAFAKGIPIISTQVGMSKDYIKEDVNGFFLTKNYEEDTRKILKILDDNYFINLTRNAASMRNEILNWKQVVEKYNNEYLAFISNLPE